MYRADTPRMAMDLHYYYGDCTTPEAQARIKQNFIQTLNESLFKEACQDPLYKDKCKAENVKDKCSVVVAAGGLGWGWGCWRWFSPTGVCVCLCVCVCANPNLHFSLSNKTEQNKHYEKDRYLVPLFNRW